MTEKSIIIIGAGLAGLSAGCYVQMNGYQSQIFEHHRAPGGVAATWKRKGYLIDGGIHFVMGHKPGTALYKVYRELGVAQATRFVDMTTYGRFTDEASGRSVEITRDLDRLAADWKALAPADTHIIDQLIAGARAMQGLDMSAAGMDKPPELMSPWGQLKEAWQMRHLFRYMMGKYAQPIADYVKVIRDPWLRECIKNLFLPDVPVWFVFMLLGLLADGQMGLLEGGSIDFVRPIEKRYKDLGGRITYQATVEEILVTDDRAVGVRLSDGSERRTGVVVSAADGYSTIFKMLGGRYLSEKTRNRYANWKLCRPLMMVSYGVAREFPAGPHAPARSAGGPFLKVGTRRAAVWNPPPAGPPFTTIMLERPFTVNDQTIDAFFVRIFNYSSRFAPPGKTVVQVEFETEWDYWNDLQGEDRARYETEKERVAAEILTRLEAHYPGISSQVEVTDVATPYTTWRYTRNHKGAWGG